MSGKVSQSHGGEEGDHQNMKKRLTVEELTKFREYYNQGYSARKIFALLGQPYLGPRKHYNANARMRRYRKKLGLPRRGSGFQGIRYRDSEYFKAKEELKERKIKERIKHIRVMIGRAKNQIEKWQIELRELERVLTKT